MIRGVRAACAQLDPHLRENVLNTAHFHSVCHSAEIGVALTGLGFLFIFLGMLFFFDRGLLAMGNVSAPWATVLFDPLAAAETARRPAAPLPNPPPAATAGAVPDGSHDHNRVPGHHQVLPPPEKLQGLWIFRGRRHPGGLGLDADRFLLGSLRLLAPL